MFVIYNYVLYYKYEEITIYKMELLNYKYLYCNNCNV